MRILLVLSVLGFAAAAKADPGLVGWWKFDEAAGKTAADASGSGNTATVRNGGWGQGRRGGALAMNGRGDGIVVVPMSESLRGTAEAMTVMAWTYRTAEHNVAVLAHAYPALFFGFHGPRFKWQIRDKPGLWTRALRKLGLVPKNTASCYAEPEHRAVLNTWIHLAATHDGKTARLYADGKEICNQPFSGSIALGTGPFTISGYLDDNGRIVDEITGRIDDVRIYDRALGEAEIGAAYRGEHGKM